VGTALSDCESRPTLVNREMAIEAIAARGGPSAPNVLRIVRDLMDKHGWTSDDFHFSKAADLVRDMLDEVWGIYHFVGLRGGISRRGYVGMQTANEAGSRYSPRAKLVLVVSARTISYPGEAARFLKAFPNNEDLVKRLLRIVLKRRRPELLDDRKYLAYAIQRAKEINEELSRLAS
jgi:hypothetical protein